MTYIPSTFPVSFSSYPDMEGKNIHAPAVTQQSLVHDDNNKTHPGRFRQLWEKIKGWMERDTRQKQIERRIQPLEYVAGPQLSQHEAISKVAQCVIEKKTTPIEVDAQPKVNIALQNPAVEINNSIKQERWNQVSLQVDSWTDALGMPIDPKIKEAVIALNALDIRTCQSCEGHLDHGGSYPWIDFDLETPETEILRKQRISIRKKEDEEEKLLKARYPDLSWSQIWDKPEAQPLLKLYEDRHKLSDKIREIEINKFKPIYLLLKKFYKTQNSSYDCLLVLDMNCATMARLESQGGPLQLIRSDEEKRSKLNEYQEEINKFTDFLKYHFYKSS